MPLAFTQEDFLVVVKFYGKCTQSKSTSVRKNGHCLKHPKTLNFFLRTVRIILFENVDCFDG